MKLLIAVFSAIAWCAALAQDVPGDTRRIVQSTKEDASYVLTVVSSLDGIFPKEERIFYFRAPQGPVDFGSMTSESTHADGAGIGYGFSARAVPRNTSVEIEVNAYWTSKSAHGKCEITLLVPYFETKKGRDAGFTYACTWKKLK